MNTVFKIYLIFVSIIGTFALLHFILGLVYMMVATVKEKHLTKKRMNELKAAIINSEMGKDINRPLTDDEKELLEKTGNLEFKETINMDTLNITKEVLSGKGKEIVSE